MANKYKIHECFIKKENGGNYNAWGNYYVSQCLSYNSSGRIATRILAKFEKEADAIKFCDLKNKELAE